MRINDAMIALLAFVVGGCCLVSTATATKEERGRDGGYSKRRMKDMTIFERQSDNGPRHSPVFSLDVGGDGSIEFPRKMALFNNDLYGDEEDLLKEREDYKIGYNQGHCVETMYTEGFFADCFISFVFYDEDSIITISGPFNIDAVEGITDSVLAITGGTGYFKGATGEVFLSTGPSEDFSSLQLDFNFY